VAGVLGTRAIVLLISSGAGDRKDGEAAGWVS
jgi:hypothetical protein